MIAKKKRAHAGPAKNTNVLLRNVATSCPLQTVGTVLPAWGSFLATRCCFPDCQELPD